MRTVILLLTAFLAIRAAGQTIDEIKDAAGRDQWDKAKKGIDSYLAVPDNAKNPEGWYLKALIYYTIATSADLDSLAPEGKSEAFTAYKKFLDIAPPARKDSIHEHEILFGICFSYLENANKAFKNRQGQAALNSFKAAEEVEDYIVQKAYRLSNFSFPVFDTQLYVNIAAAALLAGKEDIAIGYYRKIADKKILRGDFTEIYRYLVDRFDKRGDKPNRDKYIAIGRELYPSDPFWCYVLLREVENDPQKLFARYEEILRGGYCNNYTNNYNYAVEMYNYVFAQEKKPADHQKYLARIPVILRKALEFSNTNEANMLMCRYRFGLINDLMDEYNAITDPKSKKKQVLSVQIDQHYEQVLIYATNAYNLFSAKLSLAAAEKLQFKTVCQMLIEYWERKNDAGKVKELEERVKGL